MNLHLHPELLQRLASAHALGTLRGGARRRFEQIARQRPEVRAAALAWQARVAGLTELQAPLTPVPAVWLRIQNLVTADRERAALARQRAASPAAAAGWWGRLGFWRGATGAATLAAVLGGWVAVGMQQQGDARIAQLQTELQTQVASQKRIEYVAVLSDAQGQARGPEILVTFDAQHQRLTLQRVGGYQEASDKSLQLWALPPDGKPRSLGVLGEAPLLQLATAAEAVQAVPALAISLEPKGGVPGEGGPTGPVLFSGSLIRSLNL